MAKRIAQPKQSNDESKVEITPYDYTFVPTNTETEIDFLERILQIQKEGGFGTHLNEIIKERIKLINNVS